MIPAIKREEKKIEKQMSQLQHNWMEFDQPQKHWVIPPPLK
jgi:hypothetical protein